MKSLADWNLLSKIDVAAQPNLVSQGAVRLGYVIRDFQKHVHSGGNRTGQVFLRLDF
jgi:hypothetical protein